MLVVKKKKINSQGEKQFALHILNPLTARYMYVRVYVLPLGLFDIGVAHFLNGTKMFCINVHLSFVCLFSSVINSNSLLGNLCIELSLSIWEVFL